MNLELADFAQTLAVGGFVLLSLWSLFALGAGSFRPRRLLRLLPHSFGTIFVGRNWSSHIFSIALIVAVGLLAEGISSKYVSTEDLIEWVESTLRTGKESKPATGEYLPEFLRPLTKTSIRAEALFGNALQAHKVDELSISVAQVGGFRAYGGAYGAEVESNLLLFDGLRTAGEIASLPKDVTEPPLPAALANKSRLEWLATRVFYRAKNRVYLEPNYFAELVKVQKRIDFARSIALLSACLFIALGVVMIAKLLSWLVLSNARCLSDYAWQTWPLRKASAARWSELARALKITWTTRVFLIATACLVSMYGASLFAFHTEEREFDRRVYGYYATLMEGSRTTSASAWSQDGASALLRLGRDADYIAVSDAKAGETNQTDLLRLGHLRFAADGSPRIKPIPTFWALGSPPPFDLEAACWLMPHKTLLVFESGDRSGHTDASQTRAPRRIALVRLSPSTGLGYTAHEERSWFLDDDFGEIEGVLCKGRIAAESRIFAADREPGPDGEVAFIQLSLPDGGNKAKVIRHFTLPGIRQALPGYRRLVSDLLLTPDDRILAVAADDPGDQGPFKSAVYTLGELAKDDTISVRVQLMAQMEGFKVEAVALEGTPQDVVIGTDDETAGAAWRRVRLPSSAGPRQ